MNMVGYFVLLFGGLVLWIVIACLGGALQHLLPEDRTGQWDGLIFRFFRFDYDRWPRNTPAWTLVLVLGLPAIGVALAYRCSLVGRYTWQKLRP